MVGCPGMLDSLHATFDGLPHIVRIDVAQGVVAVVQCKLLGHKFQTLQVLDFLSIPMAKKVFI